MPDFTNEDLDHLFQRGSERYDFEFNPEAWRQMDQLLEKNRRRRLLWWWLFGAGLAVLLLVGILFVFPRQGDERPSSGDAPVAQERDAGQTGQAPGLSADTTLQIQSSDPIPSNQSTSSLPHSIAASGGEPAENSQAPAVEVSPKNTRREAAGLSRKTGDQARSSRLSSSAKTPSASGATPELKDRETPMATSSTIPAVSSAGNPPMQQQISTDTTNPSSAALLATAALNPLSQLPTRSVFPELPATTPELPLSILAQPFDPKTSRASSLVLSFNSAPEATAVGIDAPGKTNVRFGLSLEWRSGQHWSFGAGAYRVKKRYTAQKGEYQPPEGFWGHQMTAPMLTTGWCDIWELPVYAGYYFSGQQRNSFYIEAGFSSLLLKTEWYHYHYEHDYPGLIDTWEVHNQNNAFMGLLHIAPGYQAVPHQRWRLQVAPYVQIPLAGIGHGRLQLFSVGVNARIGMAFPVRFSK